MRGNRFLGVLIDASVLAIACGCRGRVPAATRAGASPPASVINTAASDSERSAAPWIGYHFADLPDSISYLAADTTVVNDTTYDWRDIDVGGKRWLWISIGQGQGPSGAAEWTVVTAMPVKVVDDERIFFADCRKDSIPDHLIVALGLWDDGPLFKRIHRAWKVDPAARRFAEIPVAGIDCVNTDHGE